MKVQVNNKEMTLPPSSTIAQLTVETNLPTQGVAIAVNNQLIPRPEWDGFVLQENDQLVIIRAACGG